MKEIVSSLFMLLAVMSTAACGGSNEAHFPAQQSERPENPDNDETHGGRSRYLVLYASRTDTTKRAAQLIGTLLDCEMLEVEPRTPCSDAYDAMLERAQDELAAIRQGNYPALKTPAAALDKYDMIFVGYPV